MELYLHFNLDMDRSPGFGSNITDFIRPFQTCSRCGYRPEVLNLASNIHSPDHSTKGTRSPLDGLSVLVSTRFQVLFHSPPGVLFTFPSRYYSLSVTEEYLGLEGGPPVFPPDYSCPAVLWIQLATLTFRIRDFHTVSLAFPCHSAKLKSTHYCPNPKSISTSGLASSDFARHYFRNRGCFLFLALLRCFSSGGSPRIPMDSVYGNQT